VTPRRGRHLVRLPRRERSTDQSAERSTVSAPGDATHPSADDRAERAAAPGTWRHAVDVPHAASLRTARKLREDFPGATPAQLVEIATRRFMRRVGVESGAVGAAAAWPGVGTAVSATASGAQLVAFVSEAAHYTLVVAHLHGIDLRDPAKRTSLVLAVLTGREGAEYISAQLGIESVAWFRDSFLHIRTASAHQFNHLMTRWLRSKVVSRATTSTLGRILPFGVGAAVGWGIGRTMARRVVEGVQVALGPVPIDEGDPRIIDVQVEDNDGVPDVPFENLVPPGTAPRRVEGTVSGQAPQG
jgi:hypothetical protein